MNKAAHATASIGMKAVAQVCWAERPPSSAQGVLEADGILFVAPFRATLAGGASSVKRPPRPPIPFLAAKACQGKRLASPIRARPKARLVWAAAWKPQKGWWWSGDLTPKRRWRSDAEMQQHVTVGGKS
ncbi:unnamed protein product [Prunus armeniaca]